MRHAKSAEQGRSGQSPQDETAVRGRREDSDCPRGDAGRGKHCGAVSPRRAELESLLPLEQGVSGRRQEAAGWRYHPRGDIPGSHGSPTGEWPAEAPCGRVRPRKSATPKKRDGLRLGGRYVRHTAAEKYETIRLVEGSDLPVRRTLRELQVNPVYVLYVVSPLHGARTGGAPPEAVGRLGLEPDSPAGTRARRRSGVSGSGAVAASAGVAADGPGGPFSVGIECVSHPEGPMT